jgi:hypothetical protein
MSIAPNSENNLTGIRTLRLKVKPESYAWLDAAAIEVNQVWNYCKEISNRAARPFVGWPKWLSGFDLNNLTAGATECFERIGSATIHAVGDWWLCMPVEEPVEMTYAPHDAVGLDLGLRETAATSDGDKLIAGRFYRGIEQRLAQAQRRGHRRQAKRLQRRAARRRKDALHKFSRRMVNAYQNIVIGDVSSLKLVKTPMAKSVLDAGWGILKTQLQYKGQQAKTRWDVHHAGSLWQVDEYHEPRSDLVVAEIELASVDETFELPPWIGEEVSGNPAYYNHSMVTGLRAVSER